MPLGIYTFYNTNFWTTPGGDFSAASSATTTVSTMNHNLHLERQRIGRGRAGWVSTPRVISAGSFAVMKSPRSKGTSDFGHLPGHAAKTQQRLTRRS